MNVDRPIAEALVRVKNGPDLEPFRRWLRGREEKARNDCVAQSGDALIRAQGRAQELRELQNTIEEANTLFEKLKDRK